MFRGIMKRIHAINKEIEKHQKAEMKKLESTELKTSTEIAKHFDISKNDLEAIFIKLGWIEQKGAWQTATEKGLKNGAEQKYNARTKQKYVMWNEEVKRKYEIIEAAGDIKNKTDKKETVQEEITVKKRMTKAEKKEKGDEYERYIANYFRENGYIVWEHGKEKGVQDSSIDLIIKKEEYFYFVQCKNWENWKIDHKEVKATRTDVREYLEKNESFNNLVKNYKRKILYVTSKNCLTAGAYTYIEENKEILEYQVIPMGA